MHPTKILTLAVALAASPLAAQSTYTGPANLVFTMDNLVKLNTTNTSEAAIIGDESVLSFSPGIDPYAYPMCGYGTWAAFFGDEDNDGSYTDSIITSVDAVCVPLTAAAPPSLFDCWISIQTPTDAGGYLGAGISDGDVFRLTSTGIETLISQSQIITAANSTSTNVDVVGFAIDWATGDFYFTFTATVNVNGTPLSDGGIMRIPASAMTMSGGLVSSVVAGSAEIVLTEADVNVFFQNQGFTGVTDCVGIEIDPTGGSFTNATTGKTMPHLWLCADNSAVEGIVSTKVDAATNLPGVIPSVNGVSLFGGNAFGLDIVDPNGFSVDNPFGIAFQFAVPSQPAPMHLNAYPIGQATPTTFDIDLSGVTPNGLAVYVINTFDATVAGSYVPRQAVAPIPLVGASWREFYPAIPPLASLLIQGDADGFARLSVPLPATAPGLGLVFQAGDLATLTVSAPLLTVTN